MKKIFKNKKAISLIALVITVVVLVILAIVTISLTVGNDGLIARALKAAKGYRNAQEDDKKSINDLYGQLVVASEGNITVDYEKLGEIIDTKVDEKIEEKTKDLQDKVDELETANTSLTSALETLTTKVNGIDSFKSGSSIITNSGSASAANDTKTNLTSITITPGSWIILGRMQSASMKYNRWAGFTGPTWSSTTHSASYDSRQLTVSIHAYDKTTANKTITLWGQQNSGSAVTLTGWICAIKLSNV